MAASTPETGADAAPQQPPTYYFETEEKLVISIDVGNTASSVTLAHLSWGKAPLSSSSTAAPCIRSVHSYPHTSPHLGLTNSARVPSLIAYDREDQPRAFGNECLMDEVRQRIEDGSYLLVKGWKEQMRPRRPSESREEDAVPVGGSSIRSKAKKGSARNLLTKTNRSRDVASKPAANGLDSSSSRQSLAAIGALSEFSTSSEQLLDAVDALAEHTSQFELSPSPQRFATIDGGTGAPGDFSVRKSASASKKGGAARTLGSGLRLREIYAAFLRYLVACARAWYAEAVPSGEEVFLKLWKTCVFVLATPADWTSSETDLLRHAVEDAKLLPPDFEVGRLLFVKEPVALLHFAREHAAERCWLEVGARFIVIDATGTGITVAAYETFSLAPRLRCRAHSIVRLPSGSDEVVGRFRQLVTTRLARTKLKSDPVIAHLVAEFSEKVLASFNGVVSGPETFKLRIHGKGDGTKDWAKLEKAIDSGARVRDGTMSFDMQDIEDVFRPVADELLVCLSALVPRTKAKSLLLFGGFGDSPYLRRRLSQLAAVKLIFPNAAPYLAVSEGALRLYLAASLQYRRLRRAIGVETAVDWSKSWQPGMQNREVVLASDGRRLVRGKFTPLANEGEIIEMSKRWLKPFHLKYRLAAQDPSFTTTLFARECMLESAEHQDWISDEQQRPYAHYKRIGTVWADLADLVAEQPVQEADSRERAWVQLDLTLSVEVTSRGLSAFVGWRTKAGEQRSASLPIPLDMV